MQYTDILPDPTMTPIWCDFNACGLSGEPGDNCFYSLHKADLERLKPVAGAQFFIYDDDISADGQPEVFGCTATIEYLHFHGKPLVRARPVPGAWYRGPKPNFWHQVV